MKLSYVKAFWIKEKGMYGIKFVKFGLCFSLFNKSTKTYMEWKEVLRRLVLINDFHDEYSVTKQIG